MWFGIASKKEVKKEFKKISDSFKVRDKFLKEIKDNIISKKEIGLMIKEAVLDLKVQFSMKSEPKSEPNQKKAIKQFERVIYQRAKKMRPEAIKQTIKGLLQTELKTTDIYKEIVENKRLCGKTQFYHYLSLVRNEVRALVRTEPSRTK